ncbi:MAG: exo-beta-N-acetylmuramidase NamZ domain-containing protein [Candidatus Rokuibacteriota bacterium]
MAVARASLILPLLLLAPVLGQAAVPESRPDFRDVDAAARAAVESGDIPGAVIVVGRGDDVLLHRAWGARRVLPDAAPMTEDTIFDIASLTKPLGTTLAVMSLVERGKISLDAPLGRYLKELDDGAHASVTIRRVLTHTAGFPATPPNATVQGGFPGAAQALAKLPLDSTPGTSFQYSDTGFILLGEVVRRVSGQPLDRFLERTFWKPLGLRDTSFRPPASLRPRISPTEWTEGRLLWGEVHDPRARLLGGVAGHAGMFSTAADLSRICRMLVNEGALDGTRVLRASTVRTMWERSPDGNGTRSLGWDMSSVFARVMSPFFPPDSAGHTGFTGTAVWIDPPTRAWMLVLTNRVHPNGGGAARISELRTRVAAAVGAALFRSPLPLAAGAASPAADPPVEAPAPRPGGVRSGLDVLVGQGFAPIAGHAVGLVTNQTGIDARGRRGADLLSAAPNVRLQAIFSPEHGLGGDLNADVPHGRDAATGKPVWSLYGPTRRPTPAMLKDVTLLVYDVQDVGVRYYTYLTTLVYVMEEAARQGIPLVVLDRPNPITGRVVEGPVMDPDLGSFTAPHTIPVRAGMTLGEFARMVAAERRIPVALTVIPMEGWERSIWYEDTGLPWMNPSPNIRSVTQALLYSGIGLLEATNLSVGRGTDRPFEIVGAPWLDGPGVTGALQALRLPGVAFEPVTFTPSGDRYARTPCGGVRIRVTDREAIRPVTVALALARELRARHRDQWRPESVQNLLVNRATMWAFLRGEPLDRLVIWAEKERSSFLNRRASYLIYR